MKQLRAGMIRKWSSPFLEPEQTEHATDSQILLEHVSDGYASVQQLLTSLITDARHEGSRFADQAKFLNRKFIYIYVCVCVSRNTWKMYHTSSKADMIYKHVLPFTEKSTCWKI